MNIHAVEVQSRRVCEQQHTGGPCNQSEPLVPEALGKLNNEQLLSLLSPLTESVVAKRVTSTKTSTYSLRVFPVTLHDKNGSSRRAVVTLSQIRLLEGCGGASVDPETGRVEGLPDHVVQVLGPFMQVRDPHFEEDRTVQAGLMVSSELPGFAAYLSLSSKLEGLKVQLVASQEKLSLLRNSGRSGGGGGGGGEFV